jgi:hypothetical protein
MIDYRPIIVQYIKDKLSDIQVRDGALTFEQPADANYATFYILNEEKGSFVNNTSQSINSGDTTILDIKYDPLTIVTMSLDIRGANSFLNSRNLYNSLDIISNKKLLASQGVSFMGLGAISSLPQLKNTKNEEGYLFDFVFSYDNSHVDEVLIVDVVNLKQQSVSILT